MGHYSSESEDDDYSSSFVIESTDDDDDGSADGRVGNQDGDCCAMHISSQRSQSKGISQVNRIIGSAPFHAEAKCIDGQTLISSERKGIDSFIEAKNNHVNKHAREGANIPHHSLAEVKPNKGVKSCEEKATTSIDRQLAHASDKNVDMPSSDQAEERISSIDQGTSPIRESVSNHRKEKSIELIDSGDQVVPMGALVDREYTLPCTNIAVESGVQVNMAELNETVHHRVPKQISVIDNIESCDNPNVILLKGNIAKAKNIPIDSYAMEDSISVKILLMQPAENHELPLYRCRKAIHETDAVEICHDPTWDCSFMTHIFGRQNNEKTTISLLGELLFCIYRHDSKSKNNTKYFIGQCSIHICDLLEKSVHSWFPLFLRDNRTKVSEDAGIHLNIEIILPSRIMEKIREAQQKDDNHSCSDLSSYTKEESYFRSRTHESLSTNTSYDICSEVSKRQRKDAKRRKERSRIRIEKENFNIQRRLYKISMRR